MVKSKGKPRGRPFSTGNKYGKGRQRLTQEEKELRKVGKERFKSTVAEYIDYSKADLQQVLKDKNVTALQFMIASIALKAMTQGDTSRTDWLVQHAYGKW